MKNEFHSGELGLKEPGFIRSEFHGLIEKISRIHEILDTVDFHNDDTVHILPPPHICHRGIAYKSMMC